MNSNSSENKEVFELFPAIIISRTTEPIIQNVEITTKIQSTSRVRNKKRIVIIINFATIKSNVRLFISFNKLINFGIHSFFNNGAPIFLPLLPYLKHTRHICYSII